MRTRERWRRTIGATVLAFLLIVGAASADAAPTPLLKPGTSALSAKTDGPVVARVTPDPYARRVASLGWYTPEGTPEVVLLLDRRTGTDGRPWVRVRLPVRPAGLTGWVPEEALQRPVSVTTWLRIDLARRRATLVRAGRVAWSAPIGVGRARWPTPRGEFYVRSKLRDFGSGGVYGPVAFGTSATSPVLTDWPGGGYVGVHGTNRPRLIPGRVSHGCVRLRNRDVLRLAELMPVGTPITIR